mmetsp:Transcript_22419/g.53319  ORF Transcript_22419/g.53319 Transcript_22419/m.53319 type:complete len:152 (-) Transcript_22419:533-988(-)
MLASAQKKMMDFPDTDKSNGNNNIADNEYELRKESFKNVSTNIVEARSVKPTEVTGEKVEGSIIDDAKNLLAMGTSVSGKRYMEVQNDNTATIRTGLGMIGGNENKRGKREWLPFRGSRQTRVGENYQVASLPSLETSAKKNNENSDEKGK